MVYRGKNTETDQNVAVKVIDLCKINREINPKIKKVQRRLS